MIGKVSWYHVRLWMSTIYIYIYTKMTYGGGGTEKHIIDME